MPVTNWTPTETNWGDFAHHEIMCTFEGQLKTRAVALCVWNLASSPSATPYEIETIARRDGEIELRPDGTKITAYAVKQARKILGFEDAEPAQKSKKAKRRKGKRAVTKALLRHDPGADEFIVESAGVIDDYLGLGAELASVQAAFGTAYQALMELSREHSLTLAEIDSNAAQVLAREGLLKPPARHTPPGF